MRKLMFLLLFLAFAISAGAEDVVPWVEDENADRRTTRSGDVVQISGDVSVGGDVDVGGGADVAGAVSAGDGAAISKPVAVAGGDLTSVLATLVNTTSTGLLDAYHSVAGAFAHSVATPVNVNADTLIVGASGTASLTASGTVSNTAKTIGLAGQATRSGGSGGAAIGVAALRDPVGDGTSDIGLLAGPTNYSGSVPAGSWAGVFLGDVHVSAGSTVDADNATIEAATFNSGSGYEIQNTNIVTSGRLFQNLTGGTVEGNVEIDDDRDAALGLTIRNADANTAAEATLELDTDDHIARLALRGIGHNDEPEALVINYDDVDVVKYSGSTWEFVGPIQSSSRVFSTVGSTVGRAPSAMTTSGGTGGNVGTGEDIMVPVTLAANSITASNDGVEFRAFGRFAANANNKRIRAYFGGTGGDLLVDTGANPYNNLGWCVEGTMIRGSSDQRWIVKVFIQGNNPIVTSTTTTRDLTSSQKIQLTAEATTTGDVSRQGYRFWFF